MLTFTFTGVDGSMTESEILTSGMVGRQVQLLFDESWAELAKTAVFRAGDTTRVVVDAASVVTIPEDVLSRPFARLYVGVYGTDAAGTIVIPTIMAEGPVIRYGADPIEDETAKELPVWENLQNQIGDLTALETEETTDLVTAVNELHAAQEALSANVEELETAQTFLGSSDQLQTEAKSTLVAAVNELHAGQEDLASAVEALQNAQSRMGDPEELATDEQDTLVGAVNEIHGQVAGLLEQVHLSTGAAQLLVDILSRGLYTSGQTENIDALAAELGVTVSEDLSNLIAYWDFRTGSLTDRIAGLEAVASEDVTLDIEGAHISSSTSYIMFPAGLDGASLAGHTLEVKFGEMSLDESASTMRLLTVCTGSQPATQGLQWTAKDCWSRAASVTTEFTDLNMFSGKTLIVKGSDDASQLDFYFEDQLIVSVTPGFVHSHLSIGSTISGVFPLTVEYARIYPTA